MGIYDREYYRNDGPSFLDHWTGRGKICKWLILINVAVFILQAMTNQQRFDMSDDPIGFRPGGFSLTDFLLLDTARVWHGEIWRLLTYAFVHSPFDPMHLVFNMLFLWWFGSDLEDLYGPREFLAFYLVAALFGGLAFQLTARPGATCLGASGAVMAVSVLCAIHYPTRTILIMFVIPVQLWLLLAFMVARDAWVFLSHQPSATAVQVHLAGAAIGFLYYKLNIRLLDYLPGLRDWQPGAKARTKLRVYRDESAANEPVPVTAPPHSSVEVDEQLEAKLDAVLEKVARDGQGSLTEGEREILFRASEIYKKRRSE